MTIKHTKEPIGIVDSLWPAFICIVILIFFREIMLQYFPQYIPFIKELFFLLGEIILIFIGICIVVCYVNIYEYFPKLGDKNETN